MVLKPGQEQSQVTVCLSVSGNVIAVRSGVVTRDWPCHNYTLALTYSKPSLSLSSSFPPSLPVSLYLSLCLPVTLSVCLTLSLAD